MDVDEQPSSFSLNEARQLLEDQDVAGFATLPTIMKKVQRPLKNRVSYDIVEPRLELSNDRVWLRDARNNPVELFSMRTSLIAQLIHLKPFIVPENFSFFIDWVQYVRALMDDPMGREILGKGEGSHEAELWFSQTGLPVLDMANPLQSALQTIQFAKLQGR